MALIYYILWLAIWLAMTGMISLTGVVAGLCLAILPDLIASPKRQLGTREAVRAMPKAFTVVARGLLGTASMLKNIMVSAIRVVRVLLSREIELEPCLVRFKPTGEILRSGGDLAVLTMSPDVIPVAGPNENGEVTVHALNRDAARKLVQVQNERWQS